MRAWRYLGPQEPLTQQYIERPHAGPGEVVVRVKAAGVCHSDLHILEGIAAFPTPTTLGHEAAGILDEIGPGVSGLAPGQLIAVYGANSEGDCRFCRRGLENLCSGGPPIGSIWGTSQDLSEVLSLIARHVLSPLVSTESLDGINDVPGRLRAGKVEGRIALTP